MSHRSIKNVPHKSALSGVVRIAAAGALLVSLAGCSAFYQVAPNPNPSPASANASAVKLEGMVGTGEKVNTPTGSYEKVKMNPSDLIYQYNYGEGKNPESMSGMSWSVEDGTAAQKLAVDYVANEFLNSTALESGMDGFNQWYATTAGNYFSPSIMGNVAQNPGDSHILLGNFGDKGLIPALIHDGGPRVKDVKLNLVSVLPYENDPTNQLTFGFNFDAGYRVDDANAAAIVGAYTGMTGPEVINSKYAKDNLKDGTGENVYRGKGWVNVVVNKEESGMKITGIFSKADFDTRDFANPDA